LRKIAVILLLFSVFSCSVLKRESNDNVLTEPTGNPGYYLERIRKQNISNQSFFISKAEIEVESGEDKQSFIASVKFLFPDKYIISLRSKSGIEGARVFVTGDTVLVNDRINRRLYYGKPDYIKRKFGMEPASFPFIFGDFILNKLNDTVNSNCVNDFLNLNGSIMGIRYETISDCRKAKLVNCVQMDDQNREQVRISYKKYFSEGNILVPSIVYLVSGDFRISIRIRKIEIPWEGNFNFIPGNNYEAIPLK
jgi:hypothetical protein